MHFFWTPCRTEIGLKLREAVFVNGVLYISETCHSLKHTEITLLSNVDHQLICFITGAQAKTPVEFLFLETGCLPLEYIISTRRLIYLQNILQRNNTELVKRVYIAQKANPTPGDFVDLLKEDFEFIGETISDVQIEAMTVYQYKKLEIRGASRPSFWHLRWAGGPFGPPSDPNVIGTIETGSSIRVRKGLYHFCSSNGLVSAADYLQITDKTEQKCVEKNYKKFYRYWRCWGYTDYFY